MRRGLQTMLVGLLVLAVMMGSDSLCRPVLPEPEMVTAPAGAGTAPASVIPDAISAEPVVPDSEMAMPDLVPQTVPMTSVAELIPDAAALTGGVAYRIAEGEWGGFRQKLHVLTIDPAAEAVLVRPVLSHNQLFGFETLSAMAALADALAAVNGGFAYTDGRPAGTIMLDGVLRHPSDPRFPSLLIGERRVSFSVLETPVKLVLGTQHLSVDAFNPWPIPDGITVLTSAYGTTDRLELPHQVLRITRGRVLEMVETSTPATIPEDGFLVVAQGAEAQKRLTAMGEPGVFAVWEVESNHLWPSDTLHAVACGSYLVVDGVSVVPEQDPWIGPMAGLAPRTVAGIGRQGQLVFVVAEGRIPDGPAGLSGDMLGTLLVEMGLEEAAMLDGGASSEMLMGDTVVNRLSAGRERLLSSGFVLQLVSKSTERETISDWERYHQ